MCLAIELINSLPEKFKIEHLANILAGVSNAKVQSYKHDKLKYFGAGKAHSERFWCTVMHQGIILHLLDKEIETYGLISVTPQGNEFYNNPQRLELVEDRVFSGGSDDDEDEEAAAASAAMRSGGGGGDPVLLSMLKDLRKDMSKRLKLQPWIIFSDPSLEDMSIQYPIRFEELKNCQGVGEGKARKFGKEFLELISKYVEENEIVRPDDFVVKSAPNKSGGKIYIIQSIDRRMSLEDIAEARGMEMDELMTEIEAIVSSGLKLNLNYFIEQNIDDDVVEEIYDYFKEEAQSDSIEDAIKELGSDYDEMEIRLVRIKFLCEIAS
jgi:ATP-dependent DNA helicase RecQ